MSKKKHNIRSYSSQQLEIKASKILVYENRGIGQWWYGSNDQVPQELLSVIQQSGTAMLCVDKAQQFIAKSFVDPSINNYRINASETALELAKRTAYDVKIFNAISWRVLYDGNGKPGMIYQIPIRHIRRNINGTFKYNPRMYEQFYNRAEDVIYREFNPLVNPQERQNIIASEIKEHGYQLGEILFMFTKTPFRHGDIYPFPKAYSDLESIKADAILQDLEQEKLDGKYNNDMIISLIGEDNQVQPQQDLALANSQQPDLIDANQEFEKNLANFQSGINKILVIKAESKDGMAKVDTFNGGDNLAQLALAADRIPRRVCRVFDTPAVMAGFDVATMLGNQQAMSNAMKLYQFDIEAMQQLICLAFSKVFPDVEWSLQKTTLFEFLPTEVLNELTPEEKRAFGGFEPINEETQTDQEKIISVINRLAPGAAAKLIDKLDANALSILTGLTITDPPAAPAGL